MGSPLSAIVSELIMDEIFSKSSDHFNNKFVYMTKYVDTSLLIFDKNIFQDVFKFLNNFHLRLKFTYEKSNKEINFLDISIFCNNEGTISFRHYKKPSYTSKIIHRLSNQPSY